MAREEINIGFTPNDNTGTPLRVGGMKINNNFKELYSGVVEVNNNPDTPGTDHVTIYAHTDGRVLMKDSNNVVKQINRFIVLDNTGAEQAEKIKLQFGTNFALSVDGDKLVVNLIADSGGYPVHGNELHDPDFASADHDHDGNIHEQNTDTKLGEGTEYEVSVEDLRDLLDRQEDAEPSLPDNITGWIFPPVNEIVASLPISADEGYRIIDLTDNKIYTWEDSGWVLDPITTDLMGINGFVVRVFNSPNGPNREYIYNYDTDTWIDISETFVLDLGRFQTNFGIFGNLTFSTEKIRTTRPFFGLVNGYSIRSIISSGKYVIAEGMEDIPDFPSEEYEPGFALVEATVFMSNRLFYLYYRLNTGDIFFQSCNEGVYTSWRKVSSFDNEEFGEINPGLLKTYLPEKTISANITTYLADTLLNHVKFVLLDPASVKNKKFTFRHFTGYNTMTVERSTGSIYWDGFECNLISSEGVSGFWVTLQSDGINYYIIADSGLTETNVNIVES
jgi:hypothetical protein